MYCIYNNKKRKQEQNTLYFRYGPVSLSLVYDHITQIVLKTNKFNAIYFIITIEHGFKGIFYKVKYFSKINL